ncbi:MAG: DUF1285 domain-containing protein [Hyphomicrobiales bacterium]
MAGSEESADQKQERQVRYDSILSAANHHAQSGKPPVHLWNPPFCGDLDMRIARDGTWFYLGTPIGRMPLVKLFASVLRHEDDGQYLLVTPVEKVGLQVDDVPFVGVELDRVRLDDGSDALTLRTNVDDVVVVSQDHPLRFHIDEQTGGFTPYCLIRGRLEARLGRPLLYQLADFGEEALIDGESWFGVSSCGSFFPMMRMADLEHAMDNSAG